MKRPEHTSGFEAPLGQALVSQQCKDCIFRKKQPPVDINGDGKPIDLGWIKGVCHIYTGYPGKPIRVLKDMVECEYYEKEKPNKEGVSK